MYIKCCSSILGELESLQSNPSEDFDMCSAVHARAVQSRYIRCLNDLAELELFRRVARGLMARGILYLSYIFYLNSPKASYTV